MKRPLVRWSSVPACKPRMMSKWTGTEPLSEDDPEVRGLLRDEKRRQRRGLELIASEVGERGAGGHFTVLNIMTPII